MIRGVFSRLSARHQRSRRSQDGFTLVETLVVLVIIAIMAAVAIPSMTGFINDAKEKSYVAEARTVSYGVQKYIMEEYAKGDLDAMELLTDITFNELGSDKNALSDLLEGSYTPGAQITRLDIDTSTGKFYGMTYKVKTYEIEVNFGEEVTTKTVKK